ncbi:hypothetical protein OIE66_30180 [Nonomuraea sp. NBC_01738]|uniref:hypothetical protein n=1 Tax=Nonomuraea sp. NBC_01738 TaxID=2976003 RepID=UPI002E10FB9F|nr:hypothetical protein OIE66_30180 [Nonomuraea sp. NBC_01738]
MKQTASNVEYSDFAEYDRHQRGIERHVLAAFAGGLVVGLIGAFLGMLAPQFVNDVYDPYAYLALSVAVGATATGFGWALLTTFLAAASMLVAAMGGSALQGDLGFESVGGGAGALNVLVVLLVGLGLLAFVSRRRDLWGDLATGLIGGILLSDVIDRATPGFIDSQAGFWPVPALVVTAAAVCALLALRRCVRSRLRAIAAAALVAGAFAFVIL